MGKFIFFTYVIAIVLAIIGFVIYRIFYLKKNMHDTVSPTVENTGKPISGGIKHIKIICE